MSQLEFPFQPDRSHAHEAGFLTIAEATVRVRCCERTIRRAIDSGALRAGSLMVGRGPDRPVRFGA